MRDLALTIALTFIITLTISLIAIFVISLTAPLPTTKISFVLPEKTISINAQIASTQAQRIQGLSNRQNLAPNQGMLFIFDQETARSMWMKDMNFPLDIIFLNAKKQIIKIYQNVPVCEDDPCPDYPSDMPALYAIEVNAGFIKQYQITKSTEIRF